MLAGRCCLGTLALLVVGPSFAAEKIQYNRDIRPIFAETCFACHGPDSAARKADLRLDQRQAALDTGAIVPGKPDESEAVVRVFTANAKDLMPPPATNKHLTDRQKELLRRWVAEGAEYQPHWSLIAPQRPPVPPVKNQAWVRNPIDAFILARMEQAGLAPAPEADRRTLARRLALDLTGLPPSPADVEAVAADPAPDALEKYIDRLMASKQWGEHRGRYWLDAARYADTHGLHFDNFREIWAYRDWVIEAFNRNQPFDRFTIEQLAGDLLPNPTVDQLVATGFHRCQVTTNEGGTIPEENLVFYTRDRTETTSQVWLGLTANCAVCHDHKFDPVPSRDFYRMSAFFNNTTVGPMDGNIPNSPPIISLPPADARGRGEVLAKELAAAKQQLEARRQSARADFDKWLAQGNAAELAAVPSEGLALHAPLSETSGTSLPIVIDGKPQQVALQAPLAFEPGHVAAQALKVAPPGGPELAAGDFDKDQPFSFGAWVKLPQKASGAIFSRMDEASKYRGWDLWAEQGRVGTHLIHQWPEDGLKVVTNEPVPAETWVHLLATYDGSAKAGGVTIYVNGKPQPARPQADALRGSIRATVPLAIGRRTPGSPLALSIADLRIYRRVLAPREVEQLAAGTRAAWLLAKPAAQRTAAEKDEVYPLWLANVDRGYRGLAARVAALEKEQADIIARSTIAYVMQERPGPAKAHVLYRGEYDKRRDEVTADTFSCLPPMPPELPKNRLGLAQWLVRPEHPLTARVTVNRFWQEVFGTGIVRTTGDFGVSGELPSHPELLDWLAVEFRESGWDVKRLFRLMVTSATYRQSAAATPEKIEKDPQNRLFCRGPRFRMDGEMVRDYALAVSGLLSPKIGGPSVRPYQPDGVWEAVAMFGSNTRDYRRDTGEALYRRSIYTLWKRAAPPASMEVFNAPSRETCMVRRERTNTPLQALVTLNDVQFIEAARRLAERTLKEGGSSTPARVDFLARQILFRPLRPEEVPVVEGSLQRLSAFYTKNPEQAKLLIAEGESKADPALPPAELASWTMLANELLNLDEALTK